MPNLRLSLACGPYDRTQALIDETIRPEGIGLNYIVLQPADVLRENDNLARTMAAKIKAKASTTANGSVDAMRDAREA